MSTSTTTVPVIPKDTEFIYEKKKRVNYSNNAGADWTVSLVLLLRLLAGSANGGYSTGPQAASGLGCGGGFILKMLDLDHVILGRNY